MCVLVLTPYLFYDILELSCNWSVVSKFWIALLPKGHICMGKDSIYYVWKTAVYFVFNCFSTKLFGGRQLRVAKDFPGQKGGSSQHFVFHWRPLIPLYRYFWGLLSFSHEVANIQVWTGGALELQLEWKRSISPEKITGLKWHYIPLRSLSCPKPILPRRHPQITRNFPTQSWQLPHSGTAFGCSFWAVLRWNLKILMVSKMEVLSLTLPPQIIAGY